MSRRKNFRQSDWLIALSPRKNVEPRIVGIRSTFRGSTFFRLVEIWLNANPGLALSKSGVVSFKIFLEFLRKKNNALILKLLKISGKCNGRIMTNMAKFLSRSCDSEKWVI